MAMPIWIEVFETPIRDNPTAQVAISAMLLLTLLDVLFGLLHALISHTFSSQKMREGIGHKCTSLGFAAVADIIDGTIVGGLDLGFSSPVLVVVCAYLCIMEVSSLCETFVAMRPDLGNSPIFRLLNVAERTSDAKPMGGEGDAK